MDRSQIIEFVEKHLESIKNSEPVQAIQHCKAVAWLEDKSKKTYEQYEDLCFHLGIQAVVTGNLISM